MRYTWKKGDKLELVDKGPGRRFMSDKFVVCEDIEKYPIGTIVIALSDVDVEIKDNEYNNLAYVEFPDGYRRVGLRAGRFRKVKEVKDKPVKVINIFKRK